MPNQYSLDDLELYESVFEDPTKIKKILSKVHLPGLCCRIRERLLDHARSYGGHFASGMGVVELTTALHYVFDLPKDILIWDTGHQTYPHKLLSGRANDLKTIRTLGGLHPFCSFRESPYDFSITGHAGNSISLAIGAHWAHRSFSSDGKPWVIAVIGDGALESGLALEALDKIENIEGKLLIIVNVNGQSIEPSVSHKTAIFKKIFEKNFHHQLAGSLLEALSALSLTVLKHGNDVLKIEDTLRQIKAKSEPTLLLVQTLKGAGLPEAEASPLRYHAYPMVSKQASCSRTYSELLGDWLLKTARRDQRLHVVCPAMVSSSGLKCFAREFPKQFLDVGIAEGHALALSAGAALAGAKVVVSIYSTFLQRAYDQALHDLALPRLPVILAIDRAGLVGGDGETHHGLYDLAFLYTIPGFFLLTPSSRERLLEAFGAAYESSMGPIAIRYPKGLAASDSQWEAMLPETYSIKTFKNEEFFSPKELSYHLKWRAYLPVSPAPKKVLILNFGTQLGKIISIAPRLGISILDLPLARPFPVKLLLSWACQFDHWISVEEGSVEGGIGVHLREWLASHFPKTKLNIIGVPANFIPHGTPEELERYCGFDSESLLLKIQKLMPK